MKINNTIYRDNLKNSSFDALPEGTYNTRITKTDYRISDKGRESIEFTCQIIDGEYRNRNIFASITIACKPNPNLPPTEAEERRQKAINIGEKLLNQAMTACDLTVLNDTDDFLNKEIAVKVKVTPAMNGYEARNDVQSFSKYTGNAMPSSVKTQPAVTPARPW